MSKAILITNALPYANGDLHMGHMLGHIQSDIWVRYLKLIGKTCYYICADDAHGTPIMINSMQKKISPEQLVAQYYESHIDDLAAFSINFDNFYTTHSGENEKLINEFFYELRKNNFLYKKVISQAYDEQKNMFLPDRFIKGQCPKCKAEDQYGDGCENCGAIYTPADLHNPYSIMSQSIPVIKETEHYLFDLPKFGAKLQQWLATSNVVQPEILHKLNEWFEQGLKPWDVTRDAPYFGFKIPEEENKYFYVWLDAPLGYFASFKNFCQQKNIDFSSFLDSTSENEMVHFIGKDIVYFHALFWPAVLMGTNKQLPTQISVHGFVTINGQKMSKSRGTFITIKDYLSYFDANYLRYYFAAKLNASVEDLDLNMQDFMLRINADLVGKYANIASRCAKFINNNFANMLSMSLDDAELFDNFVAKQVYISELYKTRQFSMAVKEIMHLADLANKYIADTKPWQLIKHSADKAQAVCTQALNLFRVISIYLIPIVPTISQQAEEFLQTKFSWQHLNKPLLNHAISQFKPLVKRIEQRQLDEFTQYLQQK